MAKTELEELLDRASKADLSAENPAMQVVIESVIIDWVESYQRKKEILQGSRPISLSDCYGGPGEIPDQISFQGVPYSPPEILAHVKARDEVGIFVLRQVEKFQKEDTFWRCGCLVKALASLGNNLDEIMWGNSRGEREKTLREIILDVINPSPDSMYLHLALPGAIKRLYSR